MTHLPETNFGNIPNPTELMKKPQMEDTHAMYQAGDTMRYYLTEAIEAIDKRLGVGYAASHPELIAECVRCQTLDYNGAAMTAAIYEISEAVTEISEALTGLSKD